MMKGFLVRAARFVVRVVRRFALRVVLWPFYKLSFWNVKQKSISPIFIVGAPRSGSTILYQALTNCYEVKYIDNVAASWYKELPFGMWLSGLIYKNRPHNNYLSQHGNTLMYGGHAPSECGAFWYRWMPEDMHFVPSDGISSKSKFKIRAEIDLVMSKYRMPILFKNLNMGQRLQVLHDIYPDSKIVFLRRDPRFVLKSILKARSKVGVLETEWWSVRPKNYQELLGLSEVELCAAQIFFIEQQIFLDLKLFRPENVSIVNYNELNESTVDSLARNLGLCRRAGTSMPLFKKDEIELSGRSELIEFKEAFKKYGTQKGWA